jgi:hypothetical protein
MAKTSISIEKEYNKAAPQSVQEMEDGKPPVISSEDPEVNGANDPENPLNWSPKQKWSIIMLISAITFVL